MSEWTERRATRVVQVLVVALVARALLALATGPINEDELELLQVAWLYDHGALFHRDYVYPHLPTLPLLLLPLMRALGPGLAVAEAARLLCVPALAATLAAVAWLARRVAGNALAGWIAVALLLASPAIATVVGETRGDVLAVPLVLGGLVAFARYVEGRGVAVGWLWIAAVAFGASGLLNQKGVFVALATLAAADRFHAVTLDLGRGARARRALAFVALGAAPFTLTVAALAAGGVMDREAFALVATTGQWVLNQQGFPAYKLYLLLRTVALEPLPWVLGVGVAVQRLRVSASSAGPAPTRALAGAALASVAYLAVQPIYTVQLVWLPLAVVSVLAAAPLARARPAVVVVALLGTVAVTSLDPHREPEDRAEQRERMRWVLAHVPEDRPVLDGRFGLEAFRPLVAASPRHRLQQYRPWAYAPGFRAPHEAAVLRAIAAERVGAIVAHPNYEILVPPDVRALIYRHYGAGERSEVLLPRGERAQKGGDPARP